MKRTFLFKNDLAQAYFPYVDRHSARHKLMQIINDDAHLLAELVAAGYKKSCRLLSPNQVDVIVNRLGNPWK